MFFAFIAYLSKNQFCYFLAKIDLLFFILMPIYCHSIKYLSLSMKSDAHWCSVFTPGLEGSLEDISSSYEQTLRKTLNYSTSVRCEMEPHLGWYTLNPTVKYSRKDYVWNPNTCELVGPDFSVKGNRADCLAQAQAFLSDKKDLTVKPFMSLMFKFLSGERDTPKAVAIAGPSHGPGPVKPVAVAPVAKVVEPDDDDMGPVSNIFGDDDDF